MEIICSIDSDIAILKITGKSWDEVDRVNIGYYINDSIDQNCTNVIVDLAGVTFINSTGLGCLIATLKKLRAVSKNLLLTGINPHLEQTFHVTKLDTVFDIYDNVESALLNIPT